LFLVLLDMCMNMLDLHLEMFHDKLSASGNIGQANSSKIIC